MGLRKILTDKEPALHKVCKPVTAFDSKLHKLLADMRETLIDSNGVGLAAPQIGINRNVVAVQRFDKEGHPFEVYPNISIVEYSDSLASGPEGCLSVPDRRGDVLRSTEIIIEYADMAALSKGSKEIPMVRDTISGFTAVIFQHETDHLDGVLYIDRL